MSSQGTRERILEEEREVGKVISAGDWESGGYTNPVPKQSFVTGKQMTVSESHPRSRDGSYREGGSFFTSKTTNFSKSGRMTDAYHPPTARLYSGPVSGGWPSLAEMIDLGYNNTTGDFGSVDTESLSIAGTNAISYCNPVNPVSNLGTAMAEVMREGIPTLPGIKQWRNKTKILRGLGDEYLNYQFGWAPLHREVKEVVAAARFHRDLLQQHHKGEGSDTHRTFAYPSEHASETGEMTHPSQWVGCPFSVISGGSRQVSVVTEKKKWFEGCFTYSLPSSTDSWRSAMGYGSDADHLFGISLTPNVLWELTPWSWAVDWFSNTSEVINNVTAFGLAGLVLRYGYMMEESIERITAYGHCPELGRATKDKSGGFNVSGPVDVGTYECGYETVTKVRIPAGPFGFSIGWEGLSPTQLAITAALGITRLL